MTTRPRDPGQSPGASAAMWPMVAPPRTLAAWPLIRVEGLSASFEIATALSGLDLEVADRQVLGYMRLLASDPM